MRIIDAHAHVFESLAGFGAKGELRSIGGGKARWANGDEISMIPHGLGDRGFHFDTLANLLRQNGVEKAVLLQGSFYGFQNDYTREAADAYPDLFVPSGTFDPFCQQASALTDRLIRTLRLPVIKFEASSGGGLMSYHPPFSLDGEVFCDCFAMIAQANATLTIDLGSPGMASFQPKAVAQIARRYPAMRIVVCHLLAPTPSDHDALADGLRTLALPNVWFDTAAVPWNLSPESYPYPTAKQYLSLAKEIVGADHLIWGSDVPSTLTRESYENLVGYIEQADVFTTAELERLLYDNAAVAYHIV